MNAKLVVVQGSPLGKEIPILDERFLIGRDKECHIRPNTAMVSRQHTLILMDGNDVLVRDLGSTNGTLINGQRIRGEHPVRNGDLLQVGPLTFAFSIDANANPEEEFDPIDFLNDSAEVDAISKRTTIRMVPGEEPSDLDVDMWLTGSNKKYHPDHQMFNGTTMILTVSEGDQEEMHVTNDSDEHETLEAVPKTDKPEAAEIAGNVVTEYYKKRSRGKIGHHRKTHAARRAR